MQFWSVDSLFFEFRLEEFDLEVFLKKVLSNLDFKVVKTTQ
jgi:hypothetical protein